MSRIYEELLLFNKKQKSQWKDLQKKTTLNKKITKMLLQQRAKIIRERHTKLTMQTTSNPPEWLKLRQKIPSTEENMKQSDTPLVGVNMNYYSGKLFSKIH